MISNDEWVAVKILIALTEPEKASKEIRVLQDLSNNSMTNEAYAVRLLDHFYHEGPNGRHQCLVFELLGPSLDCVITSYLPLPFSESPPEDNRLDFGVILRVSKQLFSGLASLHERGIAHGGKSLQILLQQSTEVTYTKDVMKY